MKCCPGRVPQWLLLSFKRRCRFYTVTASCICVCHKLKDIRCWETPTDDLVANEQRMSDNHTRSDEMSESGSFGTHLGGKGCPWPSLSWLLCCQMQHVVSPSGLKLNMFLDMIPV